MLTSSIHVPSFQVDDPKAAPLREVQNDHGAAIQFLYDQLTARGFEPPTSSGAWGTFARTVEGAAKLLGDKSALRALREGEKKGLEDYERAVASGTLTPQVGNHIEEELIPAQRRHVEVLDGLIESS